MDSRTTRSAQGLVEPRRHQFGIDSDLIPDFLGSCDNPALRALSSDQYFEAAVMNSVNGLSSMVGATNFAATDSGKSVHQPKF